MAVEQIVNPTGSPGPSGWYGAYEMMLDKVQSRSQPYVRTLMVERIGPCPLSRCSLEWFLVAFTAVMGLAFLLMPLGIQMQQWLMSLSTPTRSFIQPTWGMLLLVAGAFQAASLCRPKIPQHIAAFAGAMAWLVITIMMFQTGVLLFAIAAATVMLAEAFVTVRLRP